MYLVAETAQKLGIEMLLPITMSNRHRTFSFDRDGRLPDHLQRFHQLLAHSVNARFGSASARRVRRGQHLPPPTRRPSSVTRATPLLKMGKHLGGRSGSTGVDVDEPALDRRGYLILVAEVVSESGVREHVERTAGALQTSRR